MVLAALSSLDTPMRELPVFLLIALAALALQVMASRQPRERTRMLGELSGSGILLVLIAAAPLPAGAAVALGIAIAVRAVVAFGVQGAVVAPLAVLAAIALRGTGSVIDLAWVALGLAFAVSAVARLGKPASGGTAESTTRAFRFIRSDRDERLAWQRRFVSMVSHDIRAPLATIRGAAVLLRDHFEQFSAPRRAEFIATLMDGTEHLQFLVDDLLLMSQIEAGRLLIERTPVDLVEAMREASRALLARDPSRTIDVIAQADLPPVFADAVRLRQVVSNLLGNALKYSASESEVIVVLANDADGVRCTVYNEGAGISAEEQPKIFTPYATLSTRSADSTGLGLYIAKELVDVMGGRIGFDSQPGRNAAFWFWLPEARGEAASSKMAAVALA